MIETITMTASLVVLGYAFYMSSNLFWVYKSHKDYNKWIFSIISVFIISSYFLFAVVLFAFITEMLTSYSILNSLNIVLSIFLLSGAGLIGVVMKYYIKTIKSSIINNVQKEVKDWSEKKGVGKKGVDEEKQKMLKEILRLRDELDTIKLINKFAVGKDLRIIELKKKIEKLEHRK